MNYAPLGQVPSRGFFTKGILLDKQPRKFLFLCMHAHGKCGIAANTVLLSVMKLMSMLPTRMEARTASINFERVDW
jgi:hypothetical protein